MKDKDGNAIEGIAYGCPIALLMWALIFGAVAFAAWLLTSLPKGG